MIIAEVKLSDSTEWEVRLFNCSAPAFRTMANRRFVAVGRVATVSTDRIIQLLIKMLDW